MRKLIIVLNIMVKKGYLHTLANKIVYDHPDVKVLSIGGWSKKYTLAQTRNRLYN